MSLWICIWWLSINSWFPYHKKDFKFAFDFIEFFFSCLFLFKIVFGSYELLWKLLKLVTKQPVWFKNRFKNTSQLQNTHKLMLKSCECTFKLPLTFQYFKMNFFCMWYMRSLSKYRNFVLFLFWLQIRFIKSKPHLKLKLTS